jgi:hypothetical protein
MREQVTVRIKNFRMEQTMNYERIKNIPTSRDGKMVFGIVCALIARQSLNEGLAQMGHNDAGAMFAFFMTAVLLYNVGLAMVRFNTGRPLFESCR